MNSEIKTKVICPYCETNVLETGFYSKGFIEYELSKESINKKEITTHKDVDYPFVCSNCREDIELDHCEENILYDVMFSYKTLREVDHEEQQRLLKIIRGGQKELKEYVERIMV